MVWKVPKKSLANSKNCSEFSKANNSTKNSGNSKRKIFSVRNPRKLGNSIPLKILGLSKEKLMVRKHPSKVSGNLNHSTKKSGDTGTVENQCNENFRLEISQTFALSREDDFFSGHSGHSGKCCSIRNWEFRDIQTESFFKWKARSQRVTSRFVINPDWFFSVLSYPCSVLVYHFFVAPLFPTNYYFKGNLHSYQIITLNRKI